MSGLQSIGLNRLLNSHRHRLLANGCSVVPGEFSSHQDTEMRVKIVLKLSC